MEPGQLVNGALPGVEFEYTTQFLTALLPMALTVTCHGVGISLVYRFFNRHGRPLIHSKRVVARTSVTIGVVAILLATHFLGVVVWAAFYFLSGLIESFDVAMHFSVGSYTTLGAEGVKLHGRWMGFGGFEAMTACLMYGWSTAVLAAILQKLQINDG